MIQVNVKDNIPVVLVNSALTNENIKEFQQHMDNLISAGHEYIVIDFKQVDTFCSMGIGVTSNLLRLMRQQNGRLCLVGVQPQVRRLFQVTRLESYIEFHDSAEAALATASKDKP